MGNEIQIKFYCRADKYVVDEDGGVYETNAKIGLGKKLVIEFDPKDGSQNITCPWSSEMINILTHKKRVWVECAFCQSETDQVL